MAHLVIRPGDGTSSTREIASGRLTLGSGPFNSVILPAAPPGSQAEITLEGGVYRFRNAGPAGTVTLNGLATTQGELHGGDTLGLGTVECVFHEAATAAPSLVPPPAFMAVPAPPPMPAAPPPVPTFGRPAPPPMPAAPPPAPYAPPAYAPYAPMPLPEVTAALPPVPFPSLTAIAPLPTQDIEAAARVKPGSYFGKLAQAGRAALREARRHAQLSSLDSRLRAARDTETPKALFHVGLAAQRARIAPETFGVHYTKIAYLVILCQVEA